eukprot:6172913-Pleurochrysis_carterae.AAC.1
MNSQHAGATSSPRPRPPPLSARARAFAFARASSRGSKAHTIARITCSLAMTTITGVCEMLHGNGGAKKGVQ